MNKNIAVTLILGGVALAAGIFLKSMLYYANGEDTSLTLASASTSIASSVGTSALPTRLLIPALGIDAHVQDLGITKKGNMAAPSNFTDVSWYKFGTVPGQVGSAVMAGHEDNALSLDGVFKHLDNLQPGDDVYVVDASGTKLHFQVTEKEVYPYDLSGAELERVFNGKDGARLNLITCTGHWVQAIKTNNERLVVFTKLVK